MREKSQSQQNKRLIDLLERDVEAKEKIAKEAEEMNRNTALLIQTIMNQSRAAVPPGRATPAAAYVPNQGVYCGNCGNCDYCRQKAYYDYS